MILNTEKMSLWENLKQAQNPIVLYGMGDGADKVLHMCKQEGIAIQGVFASPGFSRSTLFHGFRVESLEEMEKRFPNMIVLLCFGTARPEVLEYIHFVAGRHKLYAPDVPLYGEEVFDTRYLEENMRDIQKAYNLFSDEISQQTFRCLLDFKLSGKPEYITACAQPRSELFKCLLNLKDKEIFVDCGAYRGDTVEEFLHYTSGVYSKIYAIEPDQKNFAKLIDNTISLERIEHLCKGVWEKPGTMPFQQRSGRSAALGMEGTGTPVDSMDNILAGQPATYIKYDVEGAEKQAILGSAKTIQQYRPSLLISIYHRSGDFFQLPLLLYKLCPNYNFYLRQAPHLPAWDTNLVAIPKEREDLTWKSRQAG